MEEEQWSEWFSWINTDIYQTIYDNVPGNNWGEVEIEFKCKDGSIRKAYMWPYEEWTDDDYWKSYDLMDENNKYPCYTKDVEEWRYLKDWEDD